MSLYLTDNLANLKSSWTQVAGLAMHARVAAVSATQGLPPVVLVHGLGVSGRYMIPTAARLARNHPTFVPDLPGFGESTKPVSALTIPELADALAEWFRANHLSAATLVGNSMGCQVIVDLALRYSDLVERAVLVGPTMDSQARSLLRMAGRGLLDLLSEPPALLPILLRDYLKAGPVRVTATLRHALDDPVEKKLPGLFMPVLVVRGGRDPIASLRWVEEVSRLLPKGRLVSLPGASHAANFSAPDALANVVESFIKGKQLFEHTRVRQRGPAVLSAR